ncbi:MAG: HAMP domain-containing protein, partial [Bacteroidota bacterium]
MKLNFSNVSIKYKIVLIIIFTSAIALILSGVTFFAYDKSEFRLKTLKDVSILADEIGNISWGAVVFDDYSTSSENLNTLRFNVHIQEACIFKSNGVKLAHYIRDSLFTPNNTVYTLEKDSIISGENSLMVIKPIIHEGEIVGNILIKSDLSEYTERTRSLLRVILIITASSLLIAFLIAIQLQKVISVPVRNLSDVMVEVSEKKDFSVRIEQKGRDEIGLLISGFNQMLEQIEKQNLALNLAKDQAESSARIKEQFLANMSHEIR